jgi:hypothetical protein|tara:strand:+ start:2196 stop:4037 length:1842 start_codon:yes stop_codon:yes gene_type:complete
MGLVNLTTDLKSLRFGKDRLGGGSSNQPYIKSSIPDTFSGLNKTGGPDFLLRGGLLTPGKIVKDVSRLTQMFFDFKSPNGLLFTAKQNILSRTGVATQASGLINEGAYLPTSTLLQAAGTPIGLHLNKQGLDPTVGLNYKGKSLQILKNDPLGLPIYSNKIQTNQPSEDNRLVQLKNKKISANSSQKSQPGTAVVGENNISLDNGQILNYPGGPGSTLGIGDTIIKRTSYTNNNLDFLDISNANFKNQNFITLDDNQLSDRVSLKTQGDITKDFRRDLKAPNPQVSNLPLSLDYSDYKQRLEGRVNLGNPGLRGDKSSYQQGKKDATGKNLGPLDKINALPLYKSSVVIQDKVKNDLVKFRIGVIDNDNPKKKTYIHFRAFIDDYKDTYNSKWNSSKHLGRADQVHNYQGFNRSISLSWTVAAQSKEELIPMYQKLNYLASTCAPDYSEYGYMRGNLITLTVGGWLHEQVGFIEGISYTVPTEAPWEIGIPDGKSKNTTSEGIKNDPSVKELPMVIKVSGFKFTPIHDFVPAVQKNEFGNGSKEWNGSSLKYGNFIESFGPEQYIQLSNGNDVKRDLQGNATPESLKVGLNNYGDKQGNEYNQQQNYIPIKES